MKTTKKIVALFLAVLMAMSLFSVSMTAFAATKVTKVTISKTSASLYTTQSLQLSAKVSPSNASNKKVTWSTSDKKIATVSSSGLVKALKKGTVTITAKAADGSGKKATCKVTVKTLVKITSMKLNYTSKTVYTGKQLQLKVSTVKPSNASILTYKWKSSNTKVATVSTTGKVTAVKPGTATITASATDGSGKTATCKITVKDKLVTSITLNKTKATLYPGDKLTLKATVSPTDATNAAVKWSSSSTSAATVDSKGVVTAKTAGKTATITCTAADGSGVKATCKITVGTYAKDIIVTSGVTSWYVGKTAKLTATIDPSNATNQKVTWSSSEPECVTVDADGTVTVKANSKKVKNAIGMTTTKKVTSAVITATAADGKGAKGTYTVEITDYKALTSIAFPENLSEEMFVGEQVSFGVDFTPADASERGIRYSSSNTKVATVDSRGYVKAVGKGSAVITAVSTNDSKIAVSKEIKVVPVEVIQTLAYNIKPYYAVGDVTYISFNTSPATALTKLGSRFESQNTKVAVVTSYGGSIKLGKVMFTGVGKTNVRATTGGNEVAGDWLSVEAREIRATVEHNGDKISMPFVQNVSAGDAIVIDSYFYNGSNIDAEADEIIAASNDYFDVFADRDKPGRFSVIVKEEIPENGAYITLVSSKNANVATKVWFVNKEYKLPTGDKATLLNKFKTYSQSAAMVKSADFDKTVEYSNLVSDPKKSSTDMTIKFGLAPEVSLGKFLEDNNDSDIDEDELMDDMSAESMLRDLFTDPTIEDYSIKAGEYAPAITVAAADVKKVEVIDNGITYQMKLTLNDMASTVALDAVKSSAYGKTMRIVDEEFIQNYKDQLSKTGSAQLGSSAETSLSFSSINQKYSGGYVIFTINKITDKVVESEYHYLSDMSVKGAVFKMKATMTDSDNPLTKITLGVTIKTDFTMTVDSVAKYSAMTY